MYMLATFIILGKGLNRGFINVFNRRATAFHRRAKLFEK